MNADFDIKGTMTGTITVNKTYENLSSIGTGKVTKYIKDGEERDTILINEVGGSSNPSPE
ncbi:MAG: hypothetical protein IPL95_16685, partial [Saprospiraceae bacterium]|nr:hypothetical protein [Saprospiraceae bacterium]